MELHIDATCRKVALRRIAQLAQALKRCTRHRGVADGSHYHKAFHAHMLQGDAMRKHIDKIFVGHALLLVTDTTASGSLPPILHTADITDGHGTVRLQRPLPARNQCFTQDMATWLLWAEVPVSWADLSWAVANPVLPLERLSLY